MREIIKTTLNSEEGFVTVIGGKVWYKIVGKEKAGIPIIMIHGGPGFAYDYLEPLEYLSDERPVIFYDQLGCGNSEKSDDLPLWRIERFREELHELRNALKLEELIFFGQSWGTMLSVDYLLNKTQIGIKGVILSSPVMSSKMFENDTVRLISELPEEHRVALNVSIDTGITDTAEYLAAKDEFYNRHLCRMNPLPESYLRSSEKMSLTVYNEMWGNSEFEVSGNLKDFDVMDRLNEIEVPLLYTCGEYDECTPQTVLKYHESTPNSKYVVIEDASHLHHVEKIREYETIIREFIKECER